MCNETICLNIPPSARLNHKRPADAGTVKTPLKERRPMGSRFGKGVSLRRYLYLLIGSHHEKKYALSFKLLTSKSPFSGMSGNVSGLQTDMYFFTCCALGRAPVNFSSKCDTVV